MWVVTYRSIDGSHVGKIVNLTRSQAQMEAINLIQQGFIVSAERDPDFKVVDVSDYVVHANG